MKMIRNALVAMILVIGVGVSMGKGEEAPSELTDGRPVTGQSYLFQTKPGSTSGTLRIPSVFRLWVPDDVPVLRGILIHQHGCGDKATASGDTAETDLYWRAFAAKWGFALLAPRFYQQPSVDNTRTCGAWSDPAQGSDAALDAALNDFAQKSGHPELTTIPWALWGHSGGGFWIGLMAFRHPERTIAVWYRSGVPDIFTHPVAIPDAAYRVPMVFNVGVREVYDSTVANLYYTGFKYFQHFRSKDGLFGVVVDPISGHDCRDSRYLAAQFFDICFKERLPEEPGSAELREMGEGVIVPTQGRIKAPGIRFTQEPGNWFPNETFLRLCDEYSQKAWVTDKTAPPAPLNPQIDPKGVITWTHTVDLESGLAGYLIERDGAEFVRYPSRPYSEFGHPTIQANNYYDTPSQPNRPSSCLLPAGTQVEGHQWAIRSINGEGLFSDPIPCEMKSPAE